MVVLDIYFFYMFLVSNWWMQLIETVLYEFYVGILAELDFVRLER